MKITIDPHSPVPLYAQLVEQFKSKLMLGELASGDGLPSVRSLASELEVNSLTIQKAYKKLEADGVIEIKKGVGAFVSSDFSSISNEVREEKAIEVLTPSLKKAHALLGEKEKVKSLVERVLEDL